MKEREGGKKAEGWLRRRDGGDKIKRVKRRRKRKDARRECEKREEEKRRKKMKKRREEKRFTSTSGQDVLVLPYQPMVCVCVCERNDVGYYFP